MERVIRFRGKRTDSGAWVYGDLTHDADGAWINWQRTECFRDRQSSPPYYMEVPDYARVSPHTVGQFTGVHDTEGREVYEGDRVRFLTGGAGGTGMVHSGRVEWRDSEGCYVFVDDLPTLSGGESVRRLISCRRGLFVTGDVYGNESK